MNLQANKFLINLDAYCKDYLYDTHDCPVSFESLLATMLLQMFTQPNICYLVTQEQMLCFQSLLNPTQLC